MEKIFLKLKIAGLILSGLLGVLLSTEMASAYTYDFSNTSTGSSATSMSISIAIKDGSIYSLYTDSNLGGYIIYKTLPDGKSSVFAKDYSKIFKAYSMAMNDSGNLYIITYDEMGLKSKIIKFNALGEATNIMEKNSNLSKLFIDKSGNLYVNEGNYTILKIDTNNKVTTIYVGYSINNFSVAKSGIIYFVGGIKSNSVGKVTTDGKVSILKTYPESYEALAIALDSYDNIYTVGSKTFRKVSPDGTYTTLIQGNNYITGINIDSNDNIYFVSFNQVLKYTKSGFAGLSIGYIYYPKIVFDNSGKPYIISNYSQKIKKAINPTISEITKISSTNNRQPTYSFSGNSVGTINYGGSCSSKTGALLGLNNIILNKLAYGTYSDCTIQITDDFGPSNILAIPTFTIYPPTISEITKISSTNNRQPTYSFSGNTNGTIKYTGSCSSSKKSSSIGLNSIIFNKLDYGTYSDCAIQVTDEFGELSNILKIPTFTIYPPISKNFGSHTCVVNLGKVQCWGRGSLGQLGNGSATAYSLTPVEVSGITNAVYVSGGDNTNCALLSDKTVKCWGRGDWYQLGNGVATNSSVPVTVTGLTDAVSLSVGRDHSCAIVSDGTAKCWGSNDALRLGKGSDSSASPTFTSVVGGITNFVSISSGDDHNCALTSSGTIWCWGRDSVGELGDGANNNTGNPVQVSGITNAKSVHVISDESSCAILTDNTVSCWGANWYGQLGDGTNINRNTPLVVPGLTGVTQITGGYGNYSVLLSNGTVKSWGRNAYGQLGDGTTIDRNSPISVPGLTGITQIASGWSHLCALTNLGALKCVGLNNEGQLGNGTILSPKLSPADVLGIGIIQ